MGNPGSPWKECPLREALIYYERYLIEAYKTNNIKEFNYSLYIFIGGKNLNKIPNLKRCKYKIICEKRDKSYRLNITKKFDGNPTVLSEYDIMIFEEFYSHFMKGNTLKETKLNVITIKIAYIGIVLAIIIVMGVTNYHNGNISN